MAGLPERGHLAPGIAKPLPQDEAAASSASPVLEKEPREPDPSEAPPRKRRRLMSREDWGVLARVLHYAHPFRGQIGFALVLGMVAGLLTALNLLALIPVLSVILQPDTKESRFVELQQKIVAMEQQIAAEENWFSTLDERLELQKRQLQLEWTSWVIERRERVIYWMAGILVIAQIIKSILDFQSKFLLQKSFFLAMVRLKTDLYERCLGLDMQHFERLTSGDLIARLNSDIKQVRQVLTTALGEALLAPFTVLFLFASLVLLNPRLTFIVAIGMPAIVLPIAYFGKKLRTMGKRDEEEDAKILSFVQETVQGLHVVKAFTTERRELRKFRLLSRDMAQRQVRRERIRLFSGPFVEILASLAIAGVLCLGAYLVLKSDNARMEPVEFLAYLAILTRFYPPIKKVSNAFVKMQKALASADRIFEVVDIESHVVEKPHAHGLAPFEKAIDFDNVVFRYGSQGEEGTALNGFSLTIPKGRKVALVGLSGAGKTTVTKLLPRLYDVTEGAIRVDGHDIRDLSLRSLRRQMAIVTQEIILFNDTIYANIAYARPEATREEVIEASKAAYAHDFIMEQPQGYDTPVGERGNNLSGGQRQRIAIARALLANTPILILDEATSALDTQAEVIVQQAIDRLMENRTVIMIAHRLSTVVKADEICVLDAGTIVEKGTHEELLARGGAYYQMVQKAELKA